MMVDDVITYICNIITFCSMVGGLVILYALKDKWWTTLYFSTICFTSSFAGILSLDFLYTRDAISLETLLMIRRIIVGCVMSLGFLTYFLYLLIGKSVPLTTTLSIEVKKSEETKDYGN
jgi:hypothetical protein